MTAPHFDFVESVSTFPTKMAAHPLFPIYYVPSKIEATGSVIFLHGTGDNGVDFKGTVENIMRSEASLPHIRMVFPTAPSTAFTPFRKNFVNTWYDISDFTSKAEENQEDIERSAKDLISIVDIEKARGIPLNRIILAGFSRGGAMCYHLGYSYLTGVAGVAVLSSWLSKKSQTYKTLSKTGQGWNLPPLFQAHGAADRLIETKMAENTVKFFSKLKVRTQFKVYPNLDHEMSYEELQDFFKFVFSLIPLNNI